MIHPDVRQVAKASLQKMIELAESCDNDLAFYEGYQEWLVSLGDKETSVGDVEYLGICELMDYVPPLMVDGEENEEYATSEAEEWRRSMFEKWPEFSGCPTFPIDHEAYGVEFGGCDVMWCEGEYAAARVRLAKFMLEQLKKERNE